MNKGTLVICINENFPCIISNDKNDIGKISEFQPWLGGIFEVDDVLGDFINIEMFNTQEEIKWWILNHFRKLNGDEVIEYQKSCDKYKQMAENNLQMARNKVKNNVG